MVGVHSGGDVKESKRQSSGTEQMEAKVEVRVLSCGAPPQRLSGVTRQVLAAAVVSTLVLMFGMTIGWPSSVQPILHSETSPIGKLSNEEISWLASLTFLGGITGPLFWSGIADRFGRKTGGYLVSGSFLLGWGLTAFSDDYGILLAARFINGLGGSGGIIIAPTYISETAQSSIRGALGSFVMLYLNAGILFAFTLGSLLSYDSFNFTCFAVSVLFFSLFVFMPETPEYLWSKSKIESAQDSLLWLRGGNYKCIQEETLYFRKCQKGTVNYSELMSTKGTRRAMMIGLGLFTWQQLSGLVPILSYTSVIFEKSGNDLAPERAAIIVGVIQFLASFISSALVDRCGRRMLLFVSHLMMGLALTILGAHFLLDGKVNMSSFRWIPVLCLSVDVLGYSLGAGPVPYVVMSETLPIHIKGLAVSVIIWWGTLLAFINVKIFPFLIETIDLSGCLWLYAIFCFLGLIFTWRVVPETKGVPLQDILLRLNAASQNEG